MARSVQKAVPCPCALCGEPAIPSSRQQLSAEAIVFLRKKRALLPDAPLVAGAFVCKCYSKDYKAWRRSLQKVAATATPSNATSPPAPAPAPAPASAPAPAPAAASAPASAPLPLSDVTVVLVNSLTASVGRAEDAGTIAAQVLVVAGGGKLGSAEHETACMRLCTVLLMKHSGLLEEVKAGQRPASSVVRDLLARIAAAPITSIASPPRVPVILAPPTAPPATEGNRSGESDKNEKQSAASRRPAAAAAAFAVDTAQHPAAAAASGAGAGAVASPTGNAPGLSTDDVLNGMNNTGNVFGGNMLATLTGGHLQSVLLISAAPVSNAVQTIQALNKSATGYLPRAPALPLPPRDPAEAVQDDQLTAELAHAALSSSPSGLMSPAALSPDLASGTDAAVLLSSGAAAAQSLSLPSPPSGLSQRSEADLAAAPGLLTTARADGLAHAAAAAAPVTTPSVGGKRKSVAGVPHAGADATCTSKRQRLYI